MRQRYQQIGMKSCLWLLMGALLADTATAGLPMALTSSKLPAPQQPQAVRMAPQAAMQRMRLPSVGRTIVQPRTPLLARLVPQPQTAKAVMPLQRPMTMGNMPTQMNVPNIPMQTPIAPPGVAAVNPHQMSQPAWTPPQQAAVPVANPSAEQAKAHLRNAVQFETQNDIRSAINSYHQALESDSTHRLTLISFARLKHRIGDCDGAIVTYRQSLKHHPNDAVALNDLGLCLARQGDLTAGIQSLAAATRLAPEQKRYANNLATALIETGQVDAAVSALANVHGPAIAHYNVALMLHRKSDHVEASRFAAAALKLDPTLAPAQQLVAAIGTLPTEAAAPTEPTAGSTQATFEAAAEQAPEPAPANSMDELVPAATAAAMEAANEAIESAHWDFMDQR